MQRLSSAVRIPLLTCVLLSGAAALLSSGTATAQVREAAISHPTAATRVVLRVSSGGGFVAPQTNLRALPSFTLYGDGTVIVPGAVPQIFPGPAIDPLVRRKLDERQVQALLARARRAGLLARGRDRLRRHGLRRRVRRADDHADRERRRTQRDAPGVRTRHRRRQRTAVGQAGTGAAGARSLHRDAAARTGGRALHPARARGLRPALARAGSTRSGTGRVAARERSGDCRQARRERPGLSLHHGPRQGRRITAHEPALRQRAVAVGDARTSRRALPAGHAPVASR